MWFFGLIVVVLIGAVAVVASGRWGAMSTAYDDRPDMTVPARQVLTSADIESARFAVGVRGYRMDEVDTLLERVAKEVAERDRRIADLERAVAPIVDAPDGAGFTSKSPYDSSEFEDTGAHPPILVGGDFPAPAGKATQPAEPSEAPAATAGEVPQVGVPVSATAPGAAPEAATERTDESARAESAGDAEDDVDDEPETSEIPRTSHEAAADEYERLQAEARALLEAQSQPVTPRRTPATRTQQQPASTPKQPQDEQKPQPPTQQAPDEQKPQVPTQQPDGQQPPQTATQQPPQGQSPSAAAQEQSPQAFVQEQSPQALVQQSADTRPGAAEQSAPAQHWTQMPPPAEVQETAAEQFAPATHWTQAQESQYVVREQQTAGQQQAPAPQHEAASQQPPDPQQQSGAQQQASTAQQEPGSAQAASQQGEGEGWQFWPPVEEGGEGAYQRPS
ncbi:DivIVA domain-containing protein [Kribbella sp. NPDC051586]|uniref:DivIVA domain-containing protein n=1 Tax=Kribbella sp. NPDC051586 TaxID=3364118 RepID=UPI0037A2AC6A